MSKRARISVYIASGRGSDIIFCGNPGTGKSTLLSCISGLRFESGVSFGTGLTSELKFQKDPNDPSKRYADTPGLADISIAEKAAVAIHKAIEDARKKNRAVRIIFVVTMEAGRIRADDYMTINKVMASITLKGGKKVDLGSHGVIINKCTLLNEESFLTRGKSIIEQVFQTHSEVNKFPTNCIRFIPMIKSLQNKSNRVHNFEGLKDFIDLVPSITGIASVSKINTDDMVKQIEEAKAAFHKRTKEMKDIFEKKHSAQAKKFNEQLAKNQTIMKENFRKSKEKLLAKIEIDQKEKLKSIHQATERKIEAAKNTMQAEHKRQLFDLRKKIDSAKKDGAQAAKKVQGDLRRAKEQFQQEMRAAETRAKNAEAAKVAALNEKIESIRRIQPTQRLPRANADRGAGVLGTIGSILGGPIGGMIGKSLDSLF